MNYEEICSEACIKASWFGEETTNILYIYMNGFPPSHCQQHPMGSDSVRPPCHPSDISQMESAGMPLLPHQPHPALAVAAEALHGQDLWLALTTTTCPTVTPVWGTDPPLEPCQRPQSTPEEALLADTLETPSPGLEAGQHQPTVLETRTKDPLVDKRTFPIVVHLPHHTLTSYEHAFALLPLLCTCHSTPQPCSITLQAPCDLSIPWAMELTVRS